MVSPGRNIPAIHVGWDYFVCISWCVNQTNEHGMEASVLSLQKESNAQNQNARVDAEYWGPLSIMKEHFLCQGIVLFLQ